MAALLTKLRIEYSDLVVITNRLSEPPSESTTNWFNGVIRPFSDRTGNISLKIKTICPFKLRQQFGLNFQKGKILRMK